MAVRVLWITVIALLWLAQAIVSQASSSTAKPGCENFCGNVEIPYPFGMRSNCSVGKWFSIYCNRSTTPPKPFLSNPHREVTAISLNGTISVNFPITSSCNSTVQSVNLAGTPFVFSQLHNIFIGVGCNSLALMVSNTFGRNTTSTIGGCLSFCTNNKFTDGAYTCTGVDCCKTPIPSDLQLLDVILTTIPGEAKEGGCKYAFVVNQTWFNYFSSNLKSLEFVSVVLEWSVPGTVFGLLPRLSDSTYCRNDFYYNLSSVGISNPFTNCYCVPGYEGNPYLSNGCQEVDECKNRTHPNFSCQDPTTKAILTGYIDPARFIGIGVGATFGLLILLSGGCGLHKGIKRMKKAKQKKKFFKRNGGLLLKQQLAEGELNVENTKLFNSKELEKATDRFNACRILGQGGQGAVYKGMLADGKIVAVKKSKRVDESKTVEFINEVVILSQINHRNIVKLIGCCLETEVPLLVYEFISNGTLFNHLHHPNEDELPLSWNMRMKIATEIAGAIFYLHCAASHPIYHRDIKSTNILLDEKYRAKIADFGTSRSVAIDQTHLTTQAKGTYGYLDPELCQSGHFTEKSDVYSFGVVLVELLTGQHPISMERWMEGKNLAVHFVDSMNGNTLFDIIDTRVINEAKQEDIIVVANVAKRCLSSTGGARPTMREVVGELDSVQMTQTTL